VDGVVRLVAREAEIMLADSPVIEFGVIGVDEVKESWALLEEKDGAWCERRGLSVPVRPGIGIPLALVLVPRDLRRAARADG
jgi:hypothetical protein